MSSERVYNFSAGPSMLPLSVLRRAAAEMENYGGSGMSVMEMSHRSKVYMDLFQRVKSDLREVMGIPESHEILFMQGGATLQFAAIPMNLMGRTGSADYAKTGVFSKKAAAEAQKYGEVRIAASGEATGFDRIPEKSEITLSENPGYFYYCSNNTIFGTEWNYVPETGSVPLVCDMSSDMLSFPVDISRYGIVYGGVQKNMAPAGMAVVIIDRKLLGGEAAYTPTLMSYEVMAKNDSMLNTPPCYTIYMLGLVLDWVREHGGLSGMNELREVRSSMLYDFLDGSRLFKPFAKKDSRSKMNVTFRTGSEELDAEFVKSAAAQGLVNLKGHRLTGGMRASIYNAMPVEGVEKLVAFMEEFERSHR
ncbi:MAG: 3-phosphoserine/phosphohydroxythreonine transaminase [Oscillospiraceae bacterium]|nr:3-phosphoserine/phosphohydroxythreonine transaminase [Oscillospiraceae bacterium]